MSGNLAGILLAAGEASRYGSPKQLLRFKGVSLVRRAALAILETGAALTVVTGAHAEKVVAELAGLPVTLVHNADWHQGMGCSIAAGFRSLADTAAGDSAALLCLSDQPLVGATQLRRLLQSMVAGSGTIVISDYGGSHGPPCLFPADLYPELAALQGAAGARGVLTRHPDRVVAVAMPEATVDIDTPLAWQEFTGNNH